MALLALPSLRAAPRCAAAQPAPLPADRWQRWKAATEAAPRRWPSVPLHAANPRAHALRAANADMALQQRGETAVLSRWERWSLAGPPAAMPSAAAAAPAAAPLDPAVLAQLTGALSLDVSALSCDKVAAAYQAVCGAGANRAATASAAGMTAAEFEESVCRPLEALSRVACPTNGSARNGNGSSAASPVGA